MDFFEDSQRTLALLIDGDNARPGLIGKYVEEAAKYGSIAIRRIYGDWTTTNMNGWKDSLNNHAVQPIQQFRYTTGKNATDSAMIIDAMDILHRKSIEGFCIVASDSDYTRLATRIREASIFVMGIGEDKTPKAFVNACNIFIYTRNLIPKPVTSSSRGSLIKSMKMPDPLPVIKQAFAHAVNEDGWAHLASIGENLYRLDPSFDPRSYGYNQLIHLIKANPRIFEIKYQKKKGPSAVYIKMLVSK